MKRISAAPEEADIVDLSHEARGVARLDGKAVFTVESLRAPSGALHPVQQALVECHGSQCGFCTPGFAMSLFGLYKNAHAPSREAADDALSGNLCRCTGYVKIVDAIEAACSDKR